MIGVGHLIRLRPFSMSSHGILTKAAAMSRLAEKS